MKHTLERDMHKIRNRFTVILMVLSLLGLLTSCSRFDHDFDPAVVTDYQAEIFTPLQSSFNAITATDLDPVMAFYAPEYLHNGADQAAREQYIQSLFSASTTLNFVVTMQETVQLTDTTAVANWNLKAFVPEARFAIADTTYNGEKIVKRNNQWLLLGNQMSGSGSTLKQRVIVENFTFTTCPNCPEVEAVLHSLQLQYPTQFSYLEYHFGDVLDIGNGDIFSYYAGSTMPLSIFQGTTKLTGSTEAVLAQYQSLFSNLSALDSSFRIDNFDYTMTNQNLSGTVHVTPLGTAVDPSSLRLKYVLIEKVSAVTNSVGEPCRNVVRAKGSVDISTQDFANDISFDLPINVVIPDDAYLLVYVQNVPTPYANNATIYNGIEVPVSVTTK